MTLRLRSAGCTDTGRRPSNDDFLWTALDYGIFVVCDGAGARLGGRRAAEIACQTVQQYATHVHQQLGAQITDHAAQIFESVVQAAHQNIVRAQQTDAALSGMTTTMASVVFRGGMALLSHVGDSRIYLHRNEELRLLTRDHSLENYLRDNPQIKPKVKRPGKTLVRALGLKTKHLAGEHDSIQLQPDDVLLICSDGLTDSVPDWTLREILAGVRTMSVEEVAQALVRAAMSHGSMDNISVVLLEAVDRELGEEDDEGPRTAIFDVDPGAASGKLKQPLVLGWLAFLEGGRSGEVIPLEASTVIGADPGCRIVISEGFVSGRHTEVYRTAHGFSMRDLNSTNGTYVNNVRTMEAELVDGDTIRVGTTAMVFKRFVV